MRIWRTQVLADEIKNNLLEDNEWKQYYLASTIYVTIMIYLTALTARTDTKVLLAELIAVIGVIIFGISTTYETNQKGNGNGENYISRMLALSFPLSIKFFTLSLLFGFCIGMLSASQTINNQVEGWLSTVFSVVVYMLFFWRLNIHLNHINSST